MSKSLVCFLFVVLSGILSHVPSVKTFRVHSAVKQSAGPLLGIALRSAFDKAMADARNLLHPSQDRKGETKKGLTKRKTKDEFVHVARKEHENRACSFYSQTGVTALIFLSQSTRQPCPLSSISGRSVVSSPVGFVSLAFSVM